MKYDFDEIIDRQGTNSLSVEGWKQSIFGLDRDATFSWPDNDFIRMWVADMDFATPPEVLEAVRKRVGQKILGYTKVYEQEYYDVLSAWFWKRFQWKIDLEHLVFAPGIVPALNQLVPLLIKSHEGILINTPSYAPFKKAGDYSNRQVYYSRLLNKDGYYEMDYTDIIQQLEDCSKNIKLFIFCHPHNPTGRVWTREELLRIGQVCLERDIWIISDEIHSDLLRSGQTHIPLAALFPEAEKLITCTAPSKTFNLAGSMMSHIFIPHVGIRKQWKQLYADYYSPLSIVATKAAYQEGEEWLEQLKIYLDDNFTYLQGRLKELLPKAGFRVPEATYLAWIDVSAYIEEQPQKDDLAGIFVDKGLLVNDGKMFVDHGEGYIRLNIACPRSVLEKGIQRFADALLNLG
ncbi:MalY/PatB family protein [Sphingobacterium wenxiniae]|nr:PatB family C-S lyase [Sphingobacterium wenxiniae]